MPTTLNAVERASIEFEELGRNLNMLSGPIRRAAVPALAVRTMGSSTGDGMRRIAQDVTALTQVPVSCVADLSHAEFYPTQLRTSALEDVRGLSFWVLWIISWV